MIRRILVLACDPQAALRSRGMLQASGHDVTALWSLTDVQSHPSLGQFEAVVVANSFNEQNRTLSVLAEILNEQDTAPSSTRG